MSENILTYTYLCLQGLHQQLLAFYGYKTGKIQFLYYRVQKRGMINYDYNCTSIEFEYFTDNTHYDEN